ncbi:MAG: hypothetical protein H6730_37980, partial [Deltaproteobacteria bacterium]|nr:hypothetical protein [Deltaproteobacteria bacterium]
MRRALLLPLLVSCATAPPPPAEPTVVSEAGVVEIAPGVTVEVAPGWRLDKQDNLLIAHAPEGGLSLATVIERAESGEAAVHAAWARVAPDMKWPEQAVRHPPARDGWDEAVRVEYDVPVAEAYVVLAMGRRAGERWYIQLARGPADLFDRRGAQLAT